MVFGIESGGLLLVQGFNISIYALMQWCQYWVLCYCYFGWFFVLLLLLLLLLLVFLLLLLYTILVGDVLCAMPSSSSSSPWLWVVTARSVFVIFSIIPRGYWNDNEEQHILFCLRLSFGFFFFFFYFVRYFCYFVALLN